MVHAEVRFTKNRIGYRAVIQYVYESTHFVHINICNCRSKKVGTHRSVWEPAGYTRLDLSLGAKRLKNFHEPLVIVDDGMICRIQLDGPVEDAPLPAAGEIPLSHAGMICLMNNEEGVPTFLPVLVDKATGSHIPHA